MILVTGGAGFIGSNIVAALAEAGREVVICDWLREDERWRNIAKHAVADVILPAALPAWLERAGGGVEAVIHMGAISATTETDVDAIVANNVRLTLDLWEWCTTARVPFVFASSAATYGEGEQGFDDDGSGGRAGAAATAQPQWLEQAPRRPAYRDAARSRRADAMGRFPF